MRSLGLAAFLLLPVACSLHEDTSSAPVPENAPIRTLDDGPKTEKGPLLVDVAKEPPGAHCPAGGTVLRRGHDNNKNGDLDLTEVDMTDYVCNGRTTVFASRVEPRGAACPTGGKALSWGFDDDGNGVLDAGETSATEFICNGLDGATGADGKDGTTSIATVLPLAAGAECPAGGSALYTGLDKSGDGILQPAEVTGSTFVCSGANGATSLFVTSEEPAGGTCAAGGQKIAAGLDANHDGVLAATEIAKTSYVCNGVKGAVGAAAVMRTKSEGPSSECPAGAVILEGGADANGSGVLEDAEVSATARVCNGPEGKVGANGKTTLVATSSEPKGTTCPNGGTKLDIGLDANDSGVLEANEIAATRFVCNGVDVGTLATVTRVTSEPAGASCELGGDRVQSGPDGNGDGVLQDEEITRNVYVCTLRRATLLGPGTACANGGTRFDLGRDRSLDGILQDVEIESTTTSCNGPVAQIAVGPFQTYAVLADGTVKSFGYTGIPSVLPKVRAIAVNGNGTTNNHACAIAADQSLHCWGNNTAGQLGIGVISGTVPDATPVPDAQGIAQIALGVSSTCALRTDGAVYCWGSGFCGEVGNGVGISSAPSPMKVNLGSSALRISGVSGRTCAVLADATVKCWGPYMTQQGSLCSATPTSIPNVTGAVDVVTGKTQACARISDGTARCWSGLHLTGTNITSPMFAESALPALDGFGTLIGVRTFGFTPTVSTFVMNDGSTRRAGELVKAGVGVERTLPWPVLANVSSVTSTHLDVHHQCAQLNDGTVRCWGATTSSLGNLSATPWIQIIVP